MKAARGRWNSRRPRLPCLYTSLTPEAAIAEFEKHLATYGAPPRRDLVSIDVSAAPVLDLTSARTLRRHGIDPEVVVGDSARDLASYRAILAPSAALPGAVNLIIYVESTHGIQELSNGPDRITITAGFVWHGP